MTKVTFTDDGVKIVMADGKGAQFAATASDEADRAEAAANDAVTALSKISQGFGASGFVSGSLVTATGAPIASASWSATAFVPVEPDVSYRVVAAATGTAYHAWYDADQVFISSFRGTASSSLQTSDHAAPANARYARISCANTVVAGASFKPTAPRLNIEQITNIMEAHPVTTPAENVSTGDTNVEAELTRLIGLIDGLQSSLADTRNDLDESSDATAPIFVPLTPFTKAFLTAAPEEVITVASRNNDTQMTVASGKGSKLAANGSCVVFDGTAYHSLAIKSIAGDVVTVFGALPTTCNSVMTMHQADQGQHLSRYGCRALPEYLANIDRRTAYRKNPLLVYEPTNSSTPSDLNPDVYALDNVTKTIDITVLNGAGAGGFVAGTTDLVRTCQTMTGHQGITNSSAAIYATKYYVVQDAVAGRGVEFSFAVGGMDGFIEIPIAAARIPHNSNSLKTEGAVRLEVVADGSTIHDATYAAGQVEMAYVDFTRANTITIRMTLASSVPTSARLYGVRAYQKSPETGTAMFEDGDVVALLGDSWTQYPLVASGETVPTRPDGVTPGDGMQYLSEHLRDYLAADGIDIETINFGKGGTTSAWGLHWVGEVIDARPNKCIVNFGINDANSNALTGDSAYDFDPNDMWSFKVQSAGGLDGSVTYDEWLANMTAIINRLRRANIQPIVLMTPHTGSLSQSFVLMRELTSRLQSADL